jgi:hypothetical protein
VKHTLSHNKQNADQCESYLSKLEVYCALQSAHRTAQGADALPYWLFKNCALELADIITHLIDH